MKDENLSRDEFMAELTGLRRRVDECEFNPGHPFKHGLGDKGDHLLRKT